MRIIDNIGGSVAPIACEVVEHLADGSARAISAEVQEESHLAVYVDGQPRFRIACLADSLPALVAGRLFTEGLIASAADIEEIRISREEADAPNAPLRADVTLSDRPAGDSTHEDADVADVPTHGETSGPGKALPRLEPVVPIPWRVDRIFELARVFDADSPAHARTYATHSCYLATADEVPFCYEDLGRHNAFDKAIGSALIAGVDLTQCIVFTSGRLPIDMVSKAIRAGIPVLVSKAVPTDKTIQLARDHNLTLICSAHPDAIRVFNDPTQ